jgi:hypothetical protein
MSALRETQQGKSRGTNAYTYVYSHGNTKCGGFSEVYPRGNRFPLETGRSFMRCVVITTSHTHAMVLTACRVLFRVQTVTVVILSRLVYRKGVHLAAAVIVNACKRCNRIKFLIGQSSIVSSRFSIVAGFIGSFYNCACTPLYALRSVAGGDGDMSSVFDEAILKHNVCVRLVEQFCCG